MNDNFRGDTAALIRSINSLLDLDADGAIVPHGLGSHARVLLESASIRLAEITQPVGVMPDKLNAYPKMPEPVGYIEYPSCPYESAWVSIFLDAYDENQLRAFADATYTMRMTILASDGDKPASVNALRKVYICKSCEGAYADAPVSRCDCLPEKNEFVEGHIYSTQQGEKS